MKPPHVIVIVIHDDGSVMGDVDDDPLWPIGTETTIEGQARDILEKGLRRVLAGHGLPARDREDKPR